MGLVSAAHKRFVQSKKLNAMQKISIKTHKPGKGYLLPHLFILNKGRNSGKPLREACPNCFVVFLPDWEDFDSYYWLAYSLWKANFWSVFLVGSVIPFLRLPEVNKEFQVKAVEMYQGLVTHQKNIDALRLLEHKEAQFHKNLSLIADMRRVILYRYVSRSRK